MEQGLMIDPLSLLGNKPVWIFRRGWCRLRGRAGSLSFGCDRLSWSHCGRSRVRVLQTQKKRGEREESPTKSHVGEGSEKPFRFLKELKNCSH